jgi:outer membrane immunogenic protein
MKRIWLATAAVLMLVTTASATDLGVRQPPPPVGPIVPVALPFSWTGCYVGGFAGGAWASSDVDVAYSPVFGGPFDTWSYEVKGSFIGGGTAGCNWQPTGTHWVFGVEGEVGYLSLKGSASDSIFPPGPGALLASTKIGDWYGMITGRLGVAVDRVLFYAKGGAAFVDESVTVTHPAFPVLGVPAIAVTASNDDPRWTLGGGIEWAFADNWTLKGEYMAIGADNISSCGFVAPISAANYCWNNSAPDRIHTVKIGLNYLFGSGLPLAGY